MKESCQAEWHVDPRYDWPLNFFGGWNPEVDFEGYSNIFFSNGVLDPWSAGGVKKNVTTDIFAFVMQSAHHLDMRTPNPLDPPSVVEGKKLVCLV